MKKLRLSQRITNRESESFKRYLDEVREIPLLNTDEEYQLSLRAIDNNLSKYEREKALESLTKANLRFVISVAKQYISDENTLEDLVNEGNHGLVSAARRFDPHLGYKFITYAVWWIRKDIITYINDNARLVRLPNNKLVLLSKLKEEVASIEQLLERAPTLNDILNHTKEYDKNDIIFFLESERENSYSFDKPVQEEDSQSIMSDLFEDNMFGPSDKHLTDTDSLYNLNKLLGTLKKKNEREVITLLFGLDGNESLTIKDVSEILGISRERVRQIKISSLKLLKDEIKKQLN